MPRLEDLRIKKTPTAEPPKQEKSREILLPKTPQETIGSETKYASVYENFAGKGQDTRSRYGLWVVAVASVAFLLFALSFLFTKAKITVSPKSADVNLSENFQAEKDAAAEGSLPFDLVALEGTESKIVAAGEEKEIAVPATG